MKGKKLVARIPKYIFAIILISLLPYVLPYAHKDVLIVIIQILLIYEIALHQIKIDFEEDQKEDEVASKSFSEQDIIKHGGRTMHLGKCDSFSYYDGNIIVKIGNTLYLKGEDVDLLVYPDGKKIFESTTPGGFDFSLTEDGVIVKKNEQIVFIKIDT